MTGEAITLTHQAVKTELGIGIIGTGAIARSHAAGYAALSGECRLVAVADIDEEKARVAAAEIGDGTAWYADYRKMIARDDIDVVSICTPPFVHASLAVDAMRAGKHVLVEKPMAPSLRECDQMIAAAEETGRVMSVVSQTRWRPERWRAKALIDRGLLGRIVFGKVDCQWWRGPKYYEMWWRGTWEKECGGATINHAIHHIDYLLWLMGDVKRVYAEMFALSHDIEVEDTSLAIVHFASGAIGHITTTVSDHHNLDRVEVTGDRAALSIPWDVRAMKERPNGFGDPDALVVAELERAAAEIPAPPFVGHAPQIADLFESIRTGRAPVVDGVQSRRTLELITAIYKSASTGASVELPLAGDDPFYTTEGLRAGVRRFTFPRG